MPSTEVDELRSALIELYMASDVASTILDYFAQRTNNAKVTKVLTLEDRLRRAGHTISRRDVVACLKQMAEAGCGRFITGRRGQPSRLEWAVQSTAAGKVASGEDYSLALLDDAAPSMEELLGEDGDDDSATKMLQHSFRLRPTLEVSLFLPGDLSAAEASRLADYVRTLPFSP